MAVHPRLHAGYYDQTLEQLPDDATLLDALEPFAPSAELRKMTLISAGFAWVRHGQKVATLSGGERSRLLFVGLSLARYNLLMLDEPTNHLDMSGKEALMQTLQQFSGGVLLVSHDRELISQSCNRFWLVEQALLRACLRDGNSDINGAGR
jgi:ATPase subunit of ABC transporter with duplicated ATPase domains